MSAGHKFGTSRHMPNKGADTREFFVWVNPTDPMVKHNIGVIGSLHQEIVTPSSADELMFVFNPQHKQGFVSRFHSGVLRNYITEYDLERYRCERHREFPSRLHALYLFASRGDAQQYAEKHEQHIRGRVLKRGVTQGQYVYSLHDAAWIDFLRKDHVLDVDTLNVCWRGYWTGQRTEALRFQSYGSVWSPSSVIEVLFYGRLEFPNKDLTVSD